MRRGVSSSSPSPRTRLRCESGRRDFLRSGDAEAGKIFSSARQRERLEMIRMALQNQLGVDAANSHYNVATSAAATVGGAVGGQGEQEVVGVSGRVEGREESSSAPAQVNGTLANDDDGDGIYL